MHEWVLRLIESGGYWGIFLLMALENIVPPIPSELIMGLSGVSVSRGSFEFWPLLLVGTAGTTAGNYFWYFVGDRFGYERLKPVINRWGRWLTVEWDDIERASAFFRRHGHWVLFVVRFSPFMRTIISLPAGLTHMPLWKFSVFTFAGSLIWNGMLLKGGEMLGTRFEDAQKWIGYIVIASTLAGIAWYVHRVLTWKPKT